MKNFLSGQTILETVIAATLIAVAVVATLSLATNTQKETTYSKDLSVATKYNSQVVDWIKNVKTSLGWSELYGKIENDGGSPGYCLSSIPNTSTAFTTLTVGSKDNCETSPITGEVAFYRYAEISIVDADTINLKVTTYWPGKTEHSASTETTITNH